MDIKKNITINFSENDVKKIIVDYLDREGYKAAVDDVRLSVGSKIEGYGLGECEVVYFEGCHVNIKID